MVHCRWKSLINHDVTTNKMISCTTALMISGTNYKVRYRESFSPHHTKYLKYTLSRVCKSLKKFLWTNLDTSNKKSQCTVDCVVQYYCCVSRCCIRGISQLLSGTSESSHLASSHLALTDMSSRSCPEQCLFRQWI